MTDSPRDKSDAAPDRPGPADDSDVRADVRPEAAGMGTIMDLSALDDPADLKDLAPVAADRGGPDDDAADPDAPSIDDFDLSSGRGTDHHVDVPPEPPPRPTPPADRSRGHESEGQLRERLKRELKAEVLAEMRAERNAGRRGEAAGAAAEEATLDDFTVLTGADGDGDGFGLSGEIPVAPPTLPPAAPVPPPARPRAAAPAPAAPPAAAPANQGGPPPVKLPSPPTKTPPTADAPAPPPAAERSAPAPSTPEPPEFEPPESEPREPEPPKPAPYTPPKPPPQSSYKPPSSQAPRRAGKSSGGGMSLSIPEPLKDPKVLGGIAAAAAAAYFFLFAGGGYGTGQDQLRDLDALYAKYATGADVAAEQKALVAEIEPTTRGARQGDPRREAYTLARQFGRLLDDKADGLSGPQLEEEERKFKDRLDLWKGKLGMTP